FLHTFSHAGNSNSRWGSPGQTGPRIGTHALSSIFYFHRNSAALTRNANICPIASRVSMNVSQGFLHDTKQRCFLIRPKTADSVGYFDLDPNSAPFGELGRVPRHSRGEAGLFESRRMQRIRESPDVFDHDMADLHSLIDGVPQRFWEITYTSSQLSETEPQADKILRD